MHRLSLRQVALSLQTDTCNLEPRNSECSPLKTGFLYAQVKFKTGFTLPSDRHLQCGASEL